MSGLNWNVCFLSEHAARSEYGREKFILMFQNSSSLAVDDTLQLQYKTNEVYKLVIVRFNTFVQYVTWYRTRPTCIEWCFGYLHFCTQNGIQNTPYTCHKIISESVYIS